MRIQVLTKAGLFSLYLLSVTMHPSMALASELRNPLPKILVLNQTLVNQVPMVATQSLNTPAITSDSAVVVDMKTGTVVYAKNPNQTHYPASITKIMTAMLALQLGHLNDFLVASQNAVQQPPDKLYQIPGEIEQLGPLLNGMMLDSANDVAVEIAENYGHSVRGFADMMNTEAEMLGATHTHFANPSGLPNPNHVTTAYDMSIIARAAMTNATFRSIVATKTYDWKGQVWQSKLSNLNRMLFYYPGCIGIKTGFTDVAHETLVVAATHGQQTFLAVLMDAPTDYIIRHDAARILDYAFAHYTTQTIYNQGETISQIKDATGHLIPIKVAENVYATTEIGAKLSPTSELVFSSSHSSNSHVVGSLEFRDVSGNFLGQVNAVVDTPLATELKRTPVTSTTWVWMLMTSMAFMILGSIAIASKFKRNF